VLEMKLNTAATIDAFAPDLVNVVPYQKGRPFSAAPMDLWHVRRLILSDWIKANGKRPMGLWLVGGRPGGEESQLYNSLQSEMLRSAQHGVDGLSWIVTQSQKAKTEI
jgi:hypothetical protein